MQRTRVDPHLIFGISLFLALALSWSALSGAMHGTIDIVQAGVHLLVAMAISWAGCYGVGSLLHGYAQSAPPPIRVQNTRDEGAQRRADDVAPDADAA